jgi:hypothetical protein
MSGSKLRVSNPLSTTGVTFPLEPRPPPLAIFANAVFLTAGPRGPLAIRDMRHVCSTASDGLLGESLGEAFSSEAGSFDTPPLRPLEQHGAPVSNEFAREPKMDQ